MPAVESNITEGLFSIYWRLVRAGVDPREVVILIKERFWRELHEDLRANAEFQGLEYVETEEVTINGFQGRCCPSIEPSQVDRVEG